MDAEKSRRIKKILTREILYASVVVVWALLLVADTTTKKFYFQDIYVLASETGRVTHAFILAFPYIVLQLVRLTIWGLKTLITSKGKIQ